MDQKNSSYTNKCHGSFDYVLLLNNSATKIQPDVCRYCIETELLLTSTLIILNFNNMIFLNNLLHKKIINYLWDEEKNM